MNPMSGLYRLLYMRMLRAYTRRIVGDKPPDPVIRLLYGLHFWKVHGYWPHFQKPRSFSEKVWNRMLYDRDPRWTMVEDKLRVRDYVAEKVGSEYLVPLLWKGDNPEEIPFNELPMKFVIKATHGCHYNIIVKDKTQVDQTKTRVQLKKWLGENFCQDNFLGIEWGYKNIRPTLIVEEFLDENGNLPVDYKFRCFSGRVEFLTLQWDRPGHNPWILVCDRNGVTIECILGSKYDGKFEWPANFEEMIRVAEVLAEEFDFIRVDLYSLKNKIYFGELTPYPSGGCIRFVPRQYDFLFGDKWKNT